MASYWNHIVTRWKENHKDYTYIGIGSAPRTTVLENFVSEIDQIIPVFMMDIINNTKKSIRIINIDPEFAHCIEFLHEYFASKNLNFYFDNSSGLNIWTSSDNRIEIIIVGENLDNDKKLLGITNFAINTNTQLVVQKYTGASLTEIFKQVYDELSTRSEANKKYIKKKVLFDITYGEDCHCSTNMAIYKPIYDKYGNFHNIMLYTPEELLEHRDNPKIYTFAKNHYIRQYRNIIGEIQPDYRRKIQNIPLHGYKNKYDTNNVTADEIMKIMQDEVENILIIFGILNMINEEIQVKLSDYFMNYAHIDMYKWYTDIVNLFN
jgi:hypothetical protein